MQILSPQTRRFLQRLAQWYRDLQTRERWLVLGLVVVVLVVGVQRLYLAYDAHKQELIQRMERAQNDLLWIEDKRLQMAQLHQQGVAQLSEQQLLDTLVGVAEELNVQVNVSGIEIDQKPFASVTWQGSNLSRFMHYLSALTQRGASVRSVEITRGENQVTAQAQLED